MLSIRFFRHFRSIFRSSDSGPTSTLVNRIGSAKAGYATVLFPIVALTASTMLEGYQWTTLAVIGVALACLGNVVMFSWIGLVLLGRWIGLFAIGPSRPAATSLIGDVAL